MRIAHNPSTGEYLGFQGGEWKPLRVAQNEKTGEKLYLDEDGWKPLNADKAVTPDSPKAEGSFGRVAGLGARGVLEGVGDIFDMMGHITPARTLLAGVQPFVPQVADALRATRGYGEKAANALNLPTPETPGEQLGVAAMRGAASVLPTLGFGSVPAVAKGAPGLARFLTAAPLEQIAGSAAAGAASEAARQNGAGAWGQFGAGLLGGLAPSAVRLGGVGAGRSIRTTANMLDLFSDAGQKRAASRQLKRTAGPGNVKDVIASIEARQMPVEGVPQSLAQVTQNPRLAVMEKGLESSGTDGAELIELYARQRDARQNVAEELLESMETGQTKRVAKADRDAQDAYDLVEDTADNYWVDRVAQGIPERTGAQVKDVFGDLYRQEKKAVSEAYKAIDPEGMTGFNLEPLRAAFLEAQPQSRYAQKLPSAIREFLSVLDDDIMNGRVGSYEDLQAMRTTLTEIAFEAGQKGEQALANTASKMKRRLDEYLDLAAEYADRPVAPKPGSTAYRDLRREAVALAKAKVSADSPFWDTVWKHLDADSLSRDFPDAKRELAQLHGRGLFARKGEGLPIDELADSLKIQGYLAPDADSSTLVELLKSKARGKVQTAAEMGNVLEEATQYGRGFTPEQAEAFQKAKAMRREQGERFEQGYNDPLARGVMREADVMGNYFKSGAAGASAAQDFLRSVGNDPRARNAMHDYVLGLFLKESRDAAGKLSASKMDAFFKRYDAALRQFPEISDDLTLLAAQQAGADALKETLEATGKESARIGNSVLKRNQQHEAVLVGRKVDDKLGKELVDKGLLSPAEMERLRALTRSTESAQNAVNLARVHGSPTAQNLATQDILSNILGDNLDRKRNWLDMALTVPLNIPLSFFAKNFYGDATQGIKRHLVRAAADPAYAKELLEMGNVRNLKAVSDVIGDIFKAQANINARGLLDLMAEEEQKKKK